ncbi:hypothetical protein BCR32DRAFT_12981 [Anaeromyces robustus]|uniref:Uncharacterized protein n=1 Tax=Anaeromyces robustus TaxID=1754192 RepID=A0A1Y1X665_9FUNG|nr:hypothetical protein BCR32DRAFT_12981 [Anaeromyces robustus]|eukprot:ORX81277.1 hypothetical protein BCR32DRAFT_12981 [Anaeromyces robustus]
MKIDNKNYANLSISEITNTRLGVLNRKNTGVVEIMILEACDRCIQGKIKWQLTRALIAYPSPIEIDSDDFEEFVSEIEKGKIERLSKEKSKDKSLDETEQLIYHSIHVLYCQLIRNSLFYVLKRFIQAQLNLTYDENEPDYKKILTDNWKKISFTNLKKSLIVHISKQKNFLPLRIPKYYKSKNFPKLSNAVLHKKKSGPLNTGHHLPSLTVENNNSNNEENQNSFQTNNINIDSPSNNDQNSPTKVNFIDSNDENKYEVNKSINNTEDQTFNPDMNNNEKNGILTEEEQLILRKTPSMDLLKKSPYLLLRLLACMKPIPSLDNYPREKKLIESIIETVKMEESLNAEFISNLGDSLSILGEEKEEKIHDSQNNSNSSLSKLGDENEEIYNSQSNSSLSINNNKSNNNIPATTYNIINNIIIINNNNSNNNNNNTLENNTLFNNNENKENKENSNETNANNKKINLLEELNLAIDNYRKNNKNKSIMNDISIQSPNNLINSIILKNFESTCKNEYKVPTYVTTVVPSNNSIESTSTNLNNIINNKNTLESTENKNNNLLKPVKIENKKPFDINTLDLTKNASTGNRFDKKINTNTINNSHIIQKVNMNFSIKKDILNTKKYNHTTTTNDKSLLSNNTFINNNENNLKTPTNQNSNNEILKDKPNTMHNEENHISLAQGSSINLRATNYNATTSITTATVYESRNKMVAKNDCLSSNNLTHLTKEIPPSQYNVNKENNKEIKPLLKKSFSIHEQPHRKRYLKNLNKLESKNHNENSHNDDNNNNTNNNNNNNNNNQLSNIKKSRHKKKYNHFIPVNLEDIITDVKEKAINVVKEGKVKLNSYSNNVYHRKYSNNNKLDDINSNSSSSLSKSPLELSHNTNSSNGSPSLITPTSSTPTTFTTTSTVTTSIVKKGKNRVHHHLLYSKEPTHPDNFYEDSNRENDYYPISSRSSSFYDSEKNVAENGFQTPSSSPTNPLKTINSSKKKQKH